MRISQKTFYFLSFISSLAFFGCFKELDGVSWETEIVTPLAKTSLSIEDLLDDTTSVKKDQNNHITLVYREKIYSYSNPLDSLVNIQIRPLIKDVTLESLELSSQNFGSNITLGEILANDPLYQLFFPDQTTVPNNFIGTTFAPSIAPTQIDITNILQSAILTEGTLSLELDNQLPLDLTSLDFIITNTNSNIQIYSGTYNLPANSSITDQIDLAQALNGQSIEGNITVEIANISAETPPGEPTLFIDYSDYFNASIVIDNLKVSEATAIFPAQNLVDARDTVGLLGMGDVELIMAKIKKGRVSTTVRSTVEADMEMEYYIPSATLNGDVFNFLADVPAAPSGGFYEFDEDFPYDNYIFDFTGQDGTLTNTFYNELFARIDSTGELIYLSLDDTLSMEIRVEEMTPSYVEGYFGQENLIIPADTIDIEFFKSISSGGVEFRDANINLVIENGMGIDGNLTINSLKAINSSTGQTYDFPPLSPFNISEATNLQTGFIPSTESIDIPNAVNLVNILPDQIIYDISGALNPNGNTPTYNDFLYEDAELNTFLEIEIPMELKASKLQLIDTITFNDDVISSPEEIEEGTLRFIINNNFPYDATLTAFFMGPTSIVKDSLVSSTIITSGNQINPNGPAQSIESILEFAVDGNKLQNILASTQIKLIVTFDSPGTDYGKIYSTNTLDVQVTADFKYNAKTDF